MVRHKATIAFVILAAAVVFGIYRVETLTRENHRVLCALEADIQRRHDDSVAYLEKHPLGVVSPKTGAIIFTAAEIQRGIDQQESTLAALSRGGLHC